MPLLSVEHASKRFGAVAALDDVSLTVDPGEFFALLGPSGCGKTTLMRLVAGFETPDSGRVTLAGQDLAGAPPHRRPVNMMFQSYALFPHLNVFDNIAFGLRRQGASRAAIQSRVGGIARHRADAKPRRATNRAAFRRPKAARRARPRACAGAVAAAARRAARRARPQAARGDAVPAQGHSAAPENQFCHRHPRSGRGAGARRSHRRDARRQDRADRLAARDLRAPGKPLRRRLRRRDQYDRGFCRAR